MHTHTVEVAHVAFQKSFEQGRLQTGFQSHTFVDELFCLLRKTKPRIRTE